LTSPFLGVRVVKETDGLRLSMLPRIFVHKVVLPAPEGAETMKILPLLLLCKAALSF
jgi:hypothetical protein